MLRVNNRLKMSCSGFTEERQHGVGGMLGPGRRSRAPFTGSMSSIKRDVKKKLLPPPESRFVSRRPAHFPSAVLQGAWAFDSHRFLGLLGAMLSSSESNQPIGL